MPSSNENAITGRHSLAILAASGCAAISALAATWLANRVLPAAKVTEFLLFWAVLFGVFGIVAGIQQEVTRAIGAARLTDRSDGAPVFLVAGSIGGACALLIALSSPFWAPVTLPTSTVESLAIICIGVALYSAHACASGAAAGSKRWYLFATYGGGEALWRIIAMGAVALLAGNLISLEAAAVSPVLLWLALACVNGEARALLHLRADVPASRLVRNILYTMGSSTASAVLMTGFPVLLNASEPAPSGSQVFLTMGALILAVSICRSPIMIPLQAFQGVAISAFLHHRHQPIRAFLKPAGALLAIGAVGAMAAFIVGPWLFLEIYPPKPAAEFAYGLVAQGWVLAALTFGSAIMALLVLSGTAVLALDLHRCYLLGWIVAAVMTATLVFVVPLELIPRVIIALYAGPALGSFVHLAGMYRAKSFVATGE